MEEKTEEIQMEEKTEEIQMEEKTEEIQQAQETADRARIYGWVPKEEFRGDVAKWVSADTFLKRAEEVLPIARSMNKKLEHDLTMTRKELDEMRKTVKAVIQAHKKTAEGTYENRMATIRKDQMKAITEGDTDTWAKLEEEKTKLEKPADIPFEEKSTNGAEAEVIAEWKKDNKWYDTDPELGTYADSIANFISMRNPGIAPQALLAKVKEEVEKRYPDRFGNQARKRAPTVDRPDYSGGSNDNSGKKTYSDLPKDAKEACDSLVAQKVLTREQYIKTYFEA